MNAYFLLALTILLGAGACWFDLRDGKIPNKINGSAIAAGLLLNLAFNGTSGLLTALQGFGVGLGLLLIPYLMGGIGGGDVKLLAAIGALMGPLFIAKTMLFGALAGGAMALVILKFRYATVGHFSLESLHLMRVNSATGKVYFPYALPIFAGIVFATLPIL